MNSVDWYVARGSGVMSLVLLTLVVALGIASRSGRQVGGVTRFALAEVHRNAALLAVVTIAIHVTTLLLDSLSGVTVTSLVIPFRGSYRPFWQGLGTVALELLAALVITGLLRRRIPDRAFRAIHWLAYACWPVAFAHGLGTGTDSGATWMRFIAAGCAAAVLAAVAWRTAPHFTEHSDIRRPRRPAYRSGTTGRELTGRAR